MTQKDKEKQKEYAREYYKTHKEYYDLKSRQWQKDYPIKKMVTKAKQKAREKGIEFNIDVEDIIVPEFCPLLGIPLEFGAGKGSNHNPNLVSLDRIDPTKGYIKGNVQVLSLLANKMKHNASQEQLITFANNILKMFKAGENDLKTNKVPK